MISKSLNELCQELTRKSTLYFNGILVNKKVMKRPVRQGHYSQYWLTPNAKGQKMKSNNILLLSALLLSGLFISGCASQPDYREATRGGFGYTESKFTDTQYRVNFKARGTDKSKAMDYAMLRAAELTLEQEYDWFVVTDRETLVDKEHVQVSPQVGFSRRYATVTDCGALTCRTSRFPRSQFETGVFIGGSEQSEIESILNIEMGKGAQPDASTSFDARQVVENLGPKKDKVQE